MATIIRLTDAHVTLLFNDEKPLPVAEAGAPMSSSSVVKQFFKSWGDWCEHYHVAWSPSAADWRIAKRLVATHGLEELRERARRFWLRQAKPLIDGEYRQHMILFSASIKEQET